MSLASSCKLELARFSILLKIKDSVKVFKAQKLEGGHRTEKVYSGRGGHRTYFLNRVPIGGWHRTYFLNRGPFGGG